MKHFGLIALAGVGLFQGGSASCCRTNKCLKGEQHVHHLGRIEPDLGALAIVDAGPLGLAHCAAQLTVTVTGTASDVQATVTVVNSGVATSIDTVTTTATAATQTLLFTESTTTTASTQTDVATTTTTVLVPSTDVSFAPGVTTTKTIYMMEPIVPRSLQTDVPEVPKYASAACHANFAKYAKACVCAGAKVVTVTAAPPVKTVTVEAGTVTSVYSTFSSTETSTDLATATTSTTLTTVVSVTDTVTSTVTETASSTTVISETSTPTSIVTVTCKAPGFIFHAKVVQSNDGLTRYLNSVNGILPGWQIGLRPTSPLESLAMLNSHSWVFDSQGYLETAFTPVGSTEIVVPYVDISSIVPTSVRVTTRPKSEIEAGVRAGTYARIRGCIDAQTNEITLSLAGKENILSCGNNLYMSTGVGSELPAIYNCVRVFPTAIRRTMQI